MKPQSSTPISQLERGIVIGLKISSTTNLNVQKILEENKISISLQSISRIWSQWQKQGNSDTQFENSGRKKLLSQNSEQQLKDYVEEHPNSTRKDLESSNIANPQGVSGKTLTNYLSDSGYSQKKPKNVIFISETNKKKRVLWAKDILRTKKTIIRNCIFSDETWIYLQDQSQGKQWIPPEQTQPLQRERKSWPEKFMIWGAVHREGALAFRIIEGSLDSKQYLSIITDFFNDEAKKVDYSSFMQDNARPHISKQVLQYFDQNNISLLEWASQSPDINPIEKVWSLLKHKINKNMQDFQNLQQLKDFTQQTLLNDSEIKNLISKSIESIPNYLSQIITNNGDIVN
ncbi:hypothetical protein ABPG72_009092 [Tetrahymena utriculariae]